MAFDSSDFRYTLGRSIKSYPTRVDAFDDPKDTLEKRVEEFDDLQEKLWADDRYALLLIFQGMDTAGKDSTIKKVTSGVNPQGFQVFGFKAPTYLQMDHSYLWRYWQCMPERGRIGIHNRSWYEETLVVRVHPEIIANRKIPNAEPDESFWQTRYRDLTSTEAHLHANGTIIRKFFLNVSHEEQRQRLLRRLYNKDKHWKFSARDVAERAHWDDYRHAYQETLAYTHTPENPWYVIPADDKPTMRAIVASIIVETLESLDLKYPTVSAEEEALFDEALAQLESEAP